MEVKEQYQVKISKRCAALENLMMMTLTLIGREDLGQYQKEYKSFSHRESMLL
jgi:hypothetical protein